MKTYRLNNFILFSIIFLISQASWAACTQTLSPGGNVASAISSAPNGATICLNSGNYGSLSFTNIARTGYATIASASGTGAVMSPTVGSSKFIRFENMSLTSMRIDKSANIQVVNSKFVPNQPGLAVVASDQVLVDNVDFTNVNMATWSGRLTLNNATNTTVTNSIFSGVGTDSSNPKYAAADGVMVIGQARNNVIGPNNIFRNIIQAQCSVANPGSHCDSIQLYGSGPNNLITGNYFYNSDIYIMAPDGSDDITVKDNVFGDSTSTNNPWKVSFGSANNTVFEHNTVIKCNPAFDSKAGQPASSMAVVRNNLIVSGSFKTSGGNGCNSCTFNRNLFSGASSAAGTDNVIGIPTFTGGASPSTYAGHQLASSSKGYKAATDGNDIGAIISGSASTPKPATSPTPVQTPPAPVPAPTATIDAPKNLRKY